MIIKKVVQEIGCGAIPANLDSTGTPGFHRMSAAFYTTLNGLCEATSDYVIGALVSAAAREGHASHWHAQTMAWRKQVEILKCAVAGLLNEQPEAASWGVILEYAIPRRARRIDTVMIAEGALVVLEFKIGADSFDSAGVWQVEDYALDLRDFHVASRGRPIFPAVIASEAQDARLWHWPRRDGRRHVSEVARLGPGGIVQLLVLAARSARELGVEPLDVAPWVNSAYLPALGIIEAAEEIFAGHQVREIAHAASDSWTATTNAVVDAVRTAKSERRRVICFVTGVPGAGKTLVGLTLAHDPALRDSGRPGAVFLSGNGPLVRVVREALVRDLRRRGDAPRDAARIVSTFVQNVHEFLDEYGIKHPEHAPPEQVVIFDEAQRAWSTPQMQRKRGIATSEPAMMLDVMARCPGWSVVVALVGGGQEIHKGEAGLSEWGRALSERCDVWEIVASQEAVDGASGSLTGNRLFEGPSTGVRMHVANALHLPVSLRSFRAQVVTKWVNAVLSGDSDLARELVSGETEFPLALTRDLGATREWLRARVLGEEQRAIAGLVASSGALRLRAYGIELSSGFRRAYPFEEWFLASPRDVRSASRLEVAATEFECQGLELDWIGVCWGDDLTYGARERSWIPRRFAGSKWQEVKDQIGRQYLLNKYRVLLTRARRGMVLWVPRGDHADETRDPNRLDQTARFLASCGVPYLDE